MSFPRSENEKGFRPVSLPHSTCNGLKLSDVCLPFRKGRQRSFFLYGFSDAESADDVRYAGKQLDFSEPVPANIISIADNSYPQRLAISVSGEDYGYIFFGIRTSGGNSART